MLQTANGRLKLDPEFVIAIEGCTAVEESASDKGFIIHLSTGVTILATAEEIAEIKAQWVDPDDDDQDDDDDQNDDRPAMVIPPAIGTETTVGMFTRRRKQ